MYYSDLDNESFGQELDEIKQPSQPNAPSLFNPTLLAVTEDDFGPMQELQSRGDIKQEEKPSVETPEAALANLLLTPAAKKIIENNIENNNEEELKAFCSFFFIKKSGDHFYKFADASKILAIYAGYNEEEEKILHVWEPLDKTTTKSNENQPFHHCGNHFFILFGSFLFNKYVFNEKKKKHERFIVAIINDAIKAFPEILTHAELQNFFQAFEFSSLSFADLYLSDATEFFNNGQLILGKFFDFNNYNNSYMFFPYFAFASSKDSQNLNILENYILADRATSPWTKDSLRLFAMIRILELYFRNLILITLPPEIKTAWDFIYQLNLNNPLLSSETVAALIKKVPKPNSESSHYYLDKYNEIVNSLLKLTENNTKNEKIETIKTELAIIEFEKNVNSMDSNALWNKLKDNNGLFEHYIDRYPAIFDNDPYKINHQESRKFVTFFLALKHQRIADALSTLDINEDFLYNVIFPVLEPLKDVLKLQINSNAFQPKNDLPDEKLIFKLKEELFKLLDVKDLVTLPNEQLKTVFDLEFVNHQCQSKDGLIYDTKFFAFTLYFKNYSHTLKLLLNNSSSYNSSDLKKIFSDFKLIPLDERLPSDIKKLLFEKIPYKHLNSLVATNFWNDHFFNKVHEDINLIAKDKSLTAKYLNLMLSQERYDLACKLLSKTETKFYLSKFTISSIENLPIEVKLLLIEKIPFIYLKPLLPTDLNEFFSANVIKKSNCFQMLALALLQKNYEYASLVVNFITNWNIWDINIVLRDYGVTDLEKDLPFEFKLSLFLSDFTPSLKNLDFLFKIDLKSVFDVDFIKNCKEFKDFDKIIETQPISLLILALFYGYEDIAIKILKIPKFSLFETKKSLGAFGISCFSIKDLSFDFIVLAISKISKPEDLKILFGDNWFNDCIELLPKIQPQQVYPLKKELFKFLDIKNFQDSQLIFDNNFVKEYCEGGLKDAKNDKDLISKWFLLALAIHFKNEGSISLILEHMELLMFKHTSYSTIMSANFKKIFKCFQIQLPYIVSEEIFKKFSDVSNPDILKKIFSTPAKEEIRKKTEIATTYLEELKKAIDLELDRKDTSDSSNKDSRSAYKKICGYLDNTKEFSAEQKVLFLAFATLKLFKQHKNFVTDIASDIASEAATKISSIIGKFGFNSNNNNIIKDYSPTSYKNLEEYIRKNIYPNNEKFNSMLTEGTNIKTNTTVEEIIKQTENFVKNCDFSQEEKEEKKSPIKRLL